jgi:tetratricopeptide (TPR) repeat protein
MKKALTCLLLSFYLQFTEAQTTKAAMDDLIKQAQELQKKYGNAGTVKKDSKEVKNTSAVSGNTSNGLYYTDPGAYGNVDNWKFPPKNTVLLSSLPTKVFSKAALVSFLHELYAQLSTKFTAGVAASVQSITAKYANDGNQMGDAAVMGWYTNYQEEALLLIVKAAAANPDNELLLNNCAALLNMSGIEHKAIPVLKYVLQTYPNSSMVLNNLGQAYAGLGATDTAMVYLGRCMKTAPEHPEACNTAGQIEATKGNKEKAVEYFEKSIKTAYSKTAALKMHKLKKDAKIAPLVRPRVKLPEYFNLFKYDLPAQCTSTDNAAMAKAEHAAFRTMITKQAQAYGSKYGVLAPKKAEDAMQLMKANGAARKLKKDEFMAHPYWGFCSTMAGELLSDFLADLNSLKKKEGKEYANDMALLDGEYNTTFKILKDGFAEREKNCGDGKANSNCPDTQEKCTAFNALANQYLPKFAALTEDWQKKNMTVYQQYFDELVYWHYLSLHPVGDNVFTMKYYEFIIQYLAATVDIAQTKIIEPCDFTPTTPPAKESNTITDFDCPVEVEIGFIVGSFELDCDKISFSAGEGAVFSYGKNFKTKKSTLSIGIGAQVKLGAKVGPVGAQANAGASESLFITFDGNNKVEDYGLKVQAKAGAGIGASAGTAVKVKRDLAKKELSIGATFGINSGCNFNEGPFKGMAGPK